MGCYDPSVEQRREHVVAQPFPVEVSMDCAGFLPSADFSDAFAIDVHDMNLDAFEATRLAFAQPPGWIAGLLATRNFLVAPFGLKSGAEAELSSIPPMGLPVFASSPERVVVGLDDKHLDFRLIVDVKELMAGTCRVTATTLVHRNNLLGRFYLATVMPFHKTIVPALLSRLVNAPAPGTNAAGK